MVVPQVILNFKWSIQIKKATLTKKSSRFKWIDKFFDIGGGAPLQGINVKDPTSVLHVEFQGGLHASTFCCYKWCQFQSNWMCPSKMKIQDSTIYPSPILCIKPQALHMIAYKEYSSGSHWSSHDKFHVVSAFFMVIDDKGGEEWTKIWIILGWQRGRWDESASMDMDQEEKYWGGSIFLNKRSTQVGGASSWTWMFAFDMCIFMCLLVFA